MQAFMRRPLLSAAIVVLAVLGTAACASAPVRPRPTAAAPMSPDEALAAYRGDIDERTDAEASLYNPEEAEAARRHVDGIVSGGVEENFDLYIYINKSGSGPMAQHAYLFGKEGGGLKYLDTWLVSTGR